MITDSVSRFCRFVGTFMGLPVACTLLWWYWPEAHGFVLHPLGVFLIGSATFCDIVYPFVLCYVRTTEKTLVDGTVVSEEEYKQRYTHKKEE